MLQSIFSLDFLVSVLRMSTPLLFVAMAAIVSAKADVLCIAFEGIMLFAALGGVLGSAWTHGVLGGLIVGVGMGLLIALIFGYFVLYLNTAPMLIGLALNILGSSGTVYLLYMVTGLKAASTDVMSFSFPTVNIPLIQDIPILGRILSGHNLLTYVAFLSVFLVWFLLYKTALGLRIRSVGEAPHASESVGIDVRRTKLIALIIAGVLASFGGLFMSMGYLPYFTRDMVSGRGFIGIAAQNLGRGNPVLTMVCTVLFGAATALGNLSQSFRLPSQFASMLPYLATLIGLVLMNAGSGKRKAPGKKLGGKK